MAEKEAAPPQVVILTAQQPEGQQFVCAHCTHVFVANLESNALAQCNSCSQVSAVQPGFVITRVIFYFVLGLVFLGAGTGATVGTSEVASGFGEIYFVWIGAFIAGGAFILRGLMFLTIKTSMSVAGTPVGAGPQL